MGADVGADGGAVPDGAELAVVLGAGESLDSAPARSLGALGEVPTAEPETRGAGWGVVEGVGDAPEAVVGVGVRAKVEPSRTRVTSGRPS
ncbi:hypothetical protein SAMN05444320_12140 [Streptoalloteichus hindustanus]|uniref:Uncharacterized protein n=1 Tax=Streptoalloteichus hindustanus TaxID=2017 RepID=A0A1M5Q2P6_STRHI|nr:hypothetical protein SAMN05444320_12140 [Streptoalloteichus hindustanus]